MLHGTDLLIIMILTIIVMCVATLFLNEVKFDIKCLFQPRPFTIHLLEQRSLCLDQKVRFMFFQF